MEARKQRSLMLLQGTPGKRRAGESREEESLKRSRTTISTNIHRRRRIVVRSKLELGQLNLLLTKS